MWRWLSRLFRRNTEMKLYPSFKKIAKAGDDGIVRVDLRDMPPLKDGETVSVSYQYPKP